MVGAKRISSSRKKKSTSTFSFGFLCLYFYSLALDDWGFETKMGFQTFEHFYCRRASGFSKSSFRGV